MPREATEIDRTVGRNLRLMRTTAGISQTILANKIGIAYQQVQKYESGTNRINAGVLLKLAEIFQVEVSDFFEGAPRTTHERHLTPAKTHKLPTKLDLEIVRQLAAIKSSAVKRRVLSLLEALAESDSDSILPEIEASARHHNASRPTVS